MSGDVVSSGSNTSASAVHNMHVEFASDKPRVRVRVRVRIRVRVRCLGLKS
jgi:hypothetical protein